MIVLMMAVVISRLFELCGCWAKEGTKIDRLKGDRETMKYEKPELIEITAKARGASIDACSGGSTAEAECVEGAVVTGCTPGGTPVVLNCGPGGDFTP